MKKYSKLFFISVVVILTSCAPKKIELPSYEGRDFRDVLSSRKIIAEIDTTFSIIFEKPDAEMRGDGILNISDNGNLSLRVYSLGFLAMELTSKNGKSKSTPHFDRNKTALLTLGLRDCLFWWDMEDFAVQDAENYYKLTSPGRELWLDKKTFLPLRQNVYFDDGKELNIYYDDPAREKEVWYQSKMRIELSRYVVTLIVKKIDFKI